MPISRASMPNSAMPISSRFAPEEVVEEEKEKREEAQARKAKIAEALERLEGRCAVFAAPPDLCGAAEAAA